MFLQTFFAIKKNSRLADRRNPMFYQNKFAKGAFYFMYLYWAALFLFMGVMLPLAFEKDFQATESYDIMNRVLVFVFLADYTVRWLIPTDYQDISRYFMLPIRKRSLYHIFLLDKLTSWGSLIWFFFFVPFALCTDIYRLYGISGLMGYWIGLYLLLLLNHLWFIISKLLTEIKFYWLLMGIAVVYGGQLLAEFWGNEWVSNGSVELGRLLIRCHWAAFAGILWAFGGLYYAAFRLVGHLSYQLGNHSSQGKVSRLNAFQPFKGQGQLSQFFNLEIRLLTRNKMPRYQLLMYLMITVVCLGIFYIMKDEVDSSTPGMAGMWFIFGCGSLGIFFLPVTFSLDASYLEGLIVSRKSSVYQLVRAKYLFYTLVATVSTGVLAIYFSIIGINLLLLLSFYFVTLGYTYPILLFASTFNRSALELNKSMAGKANRFIVSLWMTASFMLPPFLKDFILIFLPDNEGLLLFGGLGLTGFLLHPFFLRKIADRWMKRRYEILEDLRKTK